MPAFTLGTFVAFTLDELDIITIDGQSQLTITPNGHHPYDTQTIGHQVIGPFGVVTAVTLTGLGAGTYVAGPSNQAVPMVMVDISAAQQASPTAAQLASTSTLFQLNAPPYTIYQSNGSALVAIGAGGSGVTTAAALTDIATINLPTTNAPLAAALAAAGAPTQSVSYSTTIPLDLAGNGKKMPQTVLNANSTFSVGASPVEGGNCTFSLLGNGTNIPNLSAFVNANSYTYSAASSANNIYAAIYTYGTPLLYGQLGNSVVIIPGQVTALTAGSATGTTQPLTWTAPATGGAPSDYLVEYRTTVGPGSWTTFTHSVSAIAAQTVTGLTLGTSYDYRVSGVNTAGTGTASTTITNSTVAVPGTVTGLTLGTPTTSTQPLSWTAPSGTPTDYVVQYRTTVGPGSWLTFSHAPSPTTSATVTGLGTSTSYDYQVAASNSAGTGSFSSTVTGSTSGSGSLSATTITSAAENNTTNAYLDWYEAQASANHNADFRKNGVNLIVGPTLRSVTWGTGPAGGQADTWTVGDGMKVGDSSTTSTGCAAEMSAFSPTAADARVSYTLPAGTTSRKCRFRVGCYRDTGFTGAPLVRFSLSDASAADWTQTLSTSFETIVMAEFEATYIAGSAGQTLTVSIEGPSGATSAQMFIQRVTYI